MKRATSRTLRAALGLGSVALLVWLVDPAQTLAVLRESDPVYIVASLVLMAIVLVLRAHRWWTISRDIGLPMPFMLLLELTAVSNFFNLFLPGSVGGDAYRAYRVAQVSDRRLRSLAGVVIERLTGLVALMAVCVVAMVWSYKLLPFHPGLMIGFCFLVVAGLVTGFWAAARARRLYGRFKGWIPDMVARRVPPEKWEVILEVVEDVVRRKRVFATGLMTGLVLQVVVIATYYTTSLALQTDIPLRYFYVFFPLIELASMIPITVNGLGLKEGLVVMSLRYAAVTPAASMGLAILNRLLAAVIALVGGAIWLVRRGRMKATAA
jgi:uncharacterized protein (TIRG00374 family)